MLKKLPGGDADMNFYILAMIVIAALALSFGAFLGWRFGVIHQKKAGRAELSWQIAVRTNAEYDFDKMSGRANEIIRLANEIGAAARIASDTIKTFSNTPSHPGVQAGQSSEYH
jgi:hypothetical protein